MTFWIAAGFLAVVVAGLMLLALRRGNAEAPAAGDYDLRVYRDQLKEVDRDLARRVIPPEEAERLRTEISRRILEADRAAVRRTDSGSSPRSATMAMLALLMAVVAGSFWIYVETGAPGYPDVPLQTRIAASEEMRANRLSQSDYEAGLGQMQPTRQPDADYLALIAQLRDAIESRPDDLTGHRLLAQHEAGLGNFRAAYLAQERVIAILGDRVAADEFAALAELKILAAGGAISEEAEAALTEALRRDPTNELARFLSGDMMAQLGRYDLAFRFWAPLLAQGSAEDAWYPTLRAVMPEIAWRAGQHNYQMPPSRDARGPSLEQIEAAEGMSAEDRAEMIRGMVAGLSDRLATEGGTAEDWARLIRAYGVLEDRGAASAIWTEAEVHFQDRPDELAMIHAAARDAGVAE
jgi:cytochrome c-type biogenesis protein CcmH